ncbi:phage tail protein, partial [Corallococcus llansteffanensis]
HDKADAALKKLEDENKGALKGLVDAIGEIIKILSEFKDKLMAVLRKGADTIMLILKDPIGFLGNLLAAIKQGFNQFVGNIWTHLKRGFMQWLFGSLAEAGIQVPSDLNVWSILKLVLDVLGLTYAWMRGEAVKLVGERNVALVEKLVEYITVTIKGGPQALWEKLKEDLSNLKAMVIDAIQDWLITTIVKQAVTKVLSMFNPAGAFVQAVLAIYNVVMWVIENASRILALIEAIVNSLHAIATG